MSQSTHTAIRSLSLSEIETVAGADSQVVGGPINPLSQYAALLAQAEANIIANHQAELGQAIKNRFHL
jgi:hypothetical protein